MRYKDYLSQYYEIIYNNKYGLAECNICNMYASQYIEERTDFWEEGQVLKRVFICFKHDCYRKTIIKLKLEVYNEKLRKFMFDYDFIYNPWQNDDMDVNINCSLCDFWVTKKSDIICMKMHRVENSLAGDFLDNIKIVCDDCYQLLDD